MSIVITPECAAILGKRRNPRDRDRSRDPLLGPPADMAVSRVLLAERPDIDPKEADRLSILINAALLASQGTLDMTSKAQVAGTGASNASEPNPKINLAEVRGRAEAVLKPPAWKSEGGGTYTLVGGPSAAEILAHTDIPAMADEIERLRGAVETVTLGASEWADAYEAETAKLQASEAARQAAEDVLERFVGRMDWYRRQSDPDQFAHSSWLQFELLPDARALLAQRPEQ